MLTSGISAEYGRFSGGVINAVTKSGGDIFSGSYRLNFTNDAWKTRRRSRSRGIEHPDLLSTSFYEGTPGGPIVRDRLWFFGRPIIDRVTRSRSTYTDLDPVRPRRTEQARRDQDHGHARRRITRCGAASRTTRPTSDRAASTVLSIDRTCRVTRSSRTTGWSPLQRRAVANCSRSALLAEALRLPQQRWHQHGAGRLAVPARRRWVMDITTTRRSSIATDPEDRDNWQFAGSLTYFLTTRSTGSHDMKGGIEVFNRAGTGATRRRRRATCSMRTILRRGVNRFRRQRRPDSGVRAWVSRATRTGCRRAAPRWTSRRRRSSSHDRWQAGRLVVRPRRTLRARPQRSDG